MNTLTTILTLRRYHGGPGEQRFIDLYMQDMTEITNKAGEVLAYTKQLGEYNGVLWSCHIDTVHKSANAEVFQNVIYDSEMDVMYVEDADCLGADDGAGVWLMLEMMAAGVPGQYIFHRGEERGCWGSSQIVDEHKEWLTQFTHAIAFDRRGTQSIITHQRYGRCCSDKLARHLGALLSMGHEPDDTGIYTDTAEYQGVIPECLNVSVGYEGEHGRGEMLDVGYLKRLRDALLGLTGVDIKSLPVDREPRKDDWSDYSGIGSDWGGYGNYAGRGKGGYTGVPINDDVSTDDILDMSQAALEEFCAEHPEDAAWLLYDLADKLETASVRLANVGFDTANDTW
jgi:hypothetical protein